jgi:hypothetical protein
VSAQPGKIHMGMDFKVNKDLIWDYTFSEEDYHTEAFKKWYIGRVLVRGSFEDVKNIGFDTIYQYLYVITLPGQIRKFWEWFFNLPEVKRRHEHIDRKPNPYPSPDIPSPFIKG